MMHRVLVLFLLSHAATAAQADAARPLAHPESVVLDGHAGFVSNIGARLDPAARDGDGFIARIDDQGEPVAGPAIPAPGATLDAPKGLTLLKGRLYVTDIDRVVAFDPATGRPLATFRPEGAQGLNDIAVAGERLLISDFDAGKVLSLDPATGVVNTLAEGIAGANGVVASADGATAYVVACGARFEGGGITRIDLRSGQIAPVGQARGVFDGVALTADNRLVVSDWVDVHTPRAGRLLTVDPQTGATSSLAAPPLKGPADLVREGDRLLVPVMLEGRVVTVPLD